MEQMFFDILESLGVRVEYADLSRRGHLGEYLHEKKLIRLHHDLNYREHPFVLAHETAHAINEDIPSLFGPIDMKMERRADEWAAMQLINPDQYREVELECGGHVPTMAFQLGVAEEAVLIYRRLLSRIGDAVYLRPGLGHGNWVGKFTTT